MNGNLISNVPRCESCGQHISLTSSAPPNTLFFPHILPTFSTPSITIRTLDPASDSSDEDYSPSTKSDLESGQGSTAHEYSDLSSGDEHVVRSPSPPPVTRLRKKTMASSKELDRDQSTAPATKEIGAMNHRHHSKEDDSDSFPATATLKEENMESDEHETGHNHLDFKGSDRVSDELGDADELDNNDNEDGEESALQEASAEESEDEAEDIAGESSSLCQFTSNCNTGSNDYRKVISHIFGRNKKCTTQIPESCWIIYCRKHYQRTRYRTSKAQVKTYFTIQFDNLARQLTRMQRWGGVRCWTVALRKKERDILSAEDRQIAHLRASGANVSGDTVARIQRCRERFLLPYVGDNKTFDEVRTLIDVIQQEVEDSNETELPGFELLPDIDPIDYPPTGMKKSTPKRKAAGTATSSKTPKGRRLFQDTASRHQDDDSEVGEDEELDSDAETTDVPEVLTSQKVKRQRIPSKMNKIPRPRNTEEALASGWFAKDKGLRAPPSNSSARTTPDVKPGNLRKEASRRSAPKQDSSRGMNNHATNQGSTNVSKAFEEETDVTEAPRAPTRGYDPWPNHQPRKESSRSSESNTPVPSTSNTEVLAPLNKGTKRPLPVTPTKSSSSMPPTKKARVTHSSSSKTAGQHCVSSSSPEETAYRPATPKTPPRNSPTPMRPSDHLPAMRKFSTPRASRTVTPQTKRTLAPQLDRTPTAASKSKAGDDNSDIS